MRMRDLLGTGVAVAASGRLSGDDTPGAKF
jgi:hypothetical protein